MQDVPLPLISALSDGWEQLGDAVNVSQQHARCLSAWPLYEWELKPEVSGKLQSACNRLPAHTHAKSSGSAPSPSLHDFLKIMIFMHIK